MLAAMGARLREIVDSARVVDLTHKLTPEFPLFPAYDPVRIAERFTTERDGFFVQGWSFDEHCGTHVDAPAHFGGETTIDDVDCRDLVLEIAVIDVRDRAARDEDALVVPDDILAWERRHGSLPDRAAVFALTGWTRRLPDPADYLNFDSGGVMHFPGFGADVADFLQSERPGVRAIGIDVASLDIGASTDYPAHGSWLPSGRIGIENLARLDSIPERGALAVIGVPPFAGGSGAPARILALAT